MENKKDEIELIFELIRFKDYNKGKIEILLSRLIDYPWVLGQLLWNRMGGVAYYVLKQCELLSKLNREFRNSLKSIYEYDVIRTYDYKNALSELSTYFKEVNFKYAFLKGSYLTTNLYPEGLRTSNDYDILISQNDLTKISNLLKQNGFIQGYFDYGKGIIPATREEILTSLLNRGETVPFLKKISSVALNKIEIDLNFSLDFKAESESDIVSELLANTCCFNIDRDYRICTLSKVDFLIHLCAHLFKEATVYNWVEMQRDLSLYKFCDIYAFLLEFGNQELFKRLLVRIKKFNLYKECYYAFKYTGEIYKSVQMIDGYEDFLNNIIPQDTSYLKQIFFPKKNKIFRYDLDFIDWLFCTNRKTYLI